ncbi:MAG: hypothetical protein JZU65_16120 [Chlorobium sp.]|nr:hypothetical protein [Chlorobium sp.]
MMIKQYNTEKALPQQPAEGGQEEINYSKFVSELPKEFQAEFEEALAGLLQYLHSDEGTSTILDSLKGAGENIASEIGKAALMAMDAADQGHEWSDSVKVFCGYFAVQEVAEMARAASIADIPKEQEGKIFETAAKNYIHYIIKSKPTPEEREAEAVRIQKEVEPLMTDEMRKTGHEVAQKEGVPYEQEIPPAKGGLLE